MTKWNWIIYIHICDTVRPYACVYAHIFFFSRLIRILHNCRERTTFERSTDIGIPNLHIYSYLRLIILLLVEYLMQYLHESICLLMHASIYRIIIGKQFSVIMWTIHHFTTIRKYGSLSFVGWTDKQTTILHNSYNLKNDNINPPLWQILQCSWAAIIDHVIWYSYSFRGYPNTPNHEYVHEYMN